VCQVRRLVALPVSCAAKSPALMQVKLCVLLPRIADSNGSMTRPRGRSLTQKLNAVSPQFLADHIDLGPNISRTPRNAPPKWEVCG